MNTSHENMRAVRVDALRVLENRRQRAECQEARREAEARRETFRSRIRALEAERDAIENSGVSTPGEIATAAARVGQIALEVKLTEKALAAVTAPEPAAEHMADLPHTRLETRLELARRFMSALADRRDAEASAWMRSAWGACVRPGTQPVLSAAGLLRCPVIGRTQALAERFNQADSAAAFSELLELILRESGPEPAAEPVIEPEPVNGEAEAAEPLAA